MARADTLPKHLPLTLKLSWPLILILGLVALGAGISMVLSMAASKEAPRLIARTGQVQTHMSVVQELAQTLPDIDRPQERLQAKQNLMSAVEQATRAHEEMVLPAADREVLEEALEELQRDKDVLDRLEYVQDEMVRTADRLDERDATPREIDARARALGYLARQYLLLLTHAELRIARGAEETLSRLQKLESGLIIGCGAILVIVALGLLRTAGGVIRRQISRLSHTNDELRKSRSELTTTVLAALRLANERQRLLQTMGHDIRSPLQHVILATQMAAEVPEQADEHLDRISRSVRRAHDIIEDVLTSFNARAGGELEEIDIVEFIEVLVHDFQPQASEYNLKLQMEVVSGSPRLIATRPPALRRTVENLIGNAIKYTRRGGIYVTVSGADDPDFLVAVDVADTGPGIPEDQLSEIFEPGKRLERDREGHGFGLAIARQLTDEQLGGRLTVTSTVGQGSTFQLLLPLEAPGASPTQTGSDWSTSALLARLRRSGVFEELRVIAKGAPELAGAVRGTGAEFHSAEESLPECLRRARARGHAPHLVVIDLDHVSNEEALAACQLAHSWTTPCQVVGIYSSREQLDDSDQFFNRCDFDEIVRKPPELIDVLEWLSAASQT